MVSIQNVDFDVSHKADFVYDLPSGQDAWLLILTHTPAIFLVDGAYVEYPSSCMALFRPGQQVFYRACRDSYCNDWVRFQSDDGYLTVSSPPCGVPLAVREPAYYHRLFQLLTAEYERGGAFKEIIIDKLMQVMIHKLGEAYNTKASPQMNQGIHWLKSEIYKRPDEQWTITRMGDMLNISTGYLESVYKCAFGVSCMEDVILSRIALAKKYLQNGNYSIAEIISLCGYRSSEHFYRQFKKVTGMTPRDFRTALHENDLAWRAQPPLASR